MIYSPERKRGRELARYVKTRSAQDRNEKQSDNKGKQIIEVENRKQIGWRDSETVKKYIMASRLFFLAFLMVPKIFSYQIHLN